MKLPSTNLPRTGLLLIVGVGLAARLVFAGLVVGFDRAPFGDESDYHHIAANLAAGNGYALASGEITARRPPLYPVLLAAVYKVSGPSPAIARALQVLVGTLVVWLVFRATPLYFSRRTAWLAAAATAVNPFLIFLSAYLLTENLYIVILLCLLLAVPRPDRIANWRRAATVGVLIALAALARPTGFVFGEWIFAAYLVFGGGSWRARLARGAVLVVTVFLVLVPWAVRNYRAFDRLIVFTTHGGITFYQGNNPRVLEVPQYRGNVAPLDQLPGDLGLDHMTQLEREEAAWELGKRFLRENKRKVPRLLWNKFERFWRFRSDVGLSGIRSGWWFGRDTALGNLAASVDVGFVYAVFAIPLFAFGLVVTWRRWRALLFIYGIVVCHTAISLVFHGSLRMRSPVEPVIAILAAEALVRVIDRLRKRESSLFDVGEA